MTNNDIFPQGLASGKNFCNRVLERKRLIDNIDSARSTLIMSPRRYGKTSLVLHVLNMAKIAFAHIDLYAELNEHEVQNSILSAVGDIIYAVAPAPKKALKYVTDFFAELSVSFKLINSHVQIEFAKAKKSPAKTILETLNRLDVTLKARNKRIVLFFDEFQRISQITDSETIEGALRHVAQASKNIIFIFSGSNRNLLSHMFDDRTKPLYKLCDRVVLDRISAEDYLPFIQEKAKKRWNTQLDEATIENILEITARHPYYVNVLCHRLWRKDSLPKAQEIINAWHQYALEEKTNVVNEVGLLSNNQAKMLIAIAKYGPELSPMSKEFIAMTKFSLSSASQAVNALEKKDYIALNEQNKYFIVDPLIEYVFNM